MTAARRWLIIFAMLVAWFAFPPAPQTSQVAAAPRLQSNTITLVAPANCPAAGCAPGQRLNLRYEFELGRYDPAVPAEEPNVKVCLYMPENWVEAGTFSIETTGGVTGMTYGEAADCIEDPAPPTGYSLVGIRQTNIQANAFSDSLGMAFRISTQAGLPGRVLARLFERTSTGWERTQQAFTANINVSAGGSVVYAATTPAVCDSGGYVPCYVNSGDDLAEGIGTGLKDAVDAAPSGGTVAVIGTYQVKGNTIGINKPLTLTGVSNGTITYAGSSCANTMLALREGVTVRGLAINDGACTSPSRTLIGVNSPTHVTIEYNHLTGGDKGIYVADNTGGLTVRFNQISGNTQSLFWATGANTAPLMLVANNIHGNSIGIECAAGQTAAQPHRKANHNYWGSATNIPSQDSTHCVITPGKQLGAPILPRQGQPGLQAQLVTVTADKTYAFNNQIAYHRSGGPADFPLYIINHGYALENSVPFTRSLGGSPTPCGNYFDVFLPDGVIPNNETTLELYFKYNATPACVAVIDSSQYCDQTFDRSRYPLWWYDPANNVTSLWDTTGQNPSGSNANGAVGQTTTCRIPEKEIQVSINADGSPNFANDLNFTPFFTGIQVIRTYSVAASNNVVTVNWTTNNEPDVDGFYVLRSTDGQNFSPISDLIERSGSALSGASYRFIDSGRTSGTTYYYRLQILRTDGLSIFSDIHSAVATDATATITPTPGPTATSTRTPGPTPTWTIPPPTRTNTPTRVPQQQPTRIPSHTPTVRTSTPTRIGLTLPTSAVTRSLTVTRTLAAGTPAGGYPAPNETLASGGGYPAPNETLTLPTDGYPASTLPGGYPAPVSTGTGTPGAEGTAIGMIGSTTPGGPVEPPSGGAIGGDEPGLLDQPWLGVAKMLLTGFSASMVLIGTVGLWFFYMRKTTKAV